MIDGHQLIIYRICAKRLTDSIMLILQIGPKNSSLTRFLYFASAGLPLPHNVATRVSGEPMLFHAINRTTRISREIGGIGLHPLPNPPLEQCKHGNESEHTGLQLHASTGHLSFKRTMRAIRLVGE